MQAEVANRETPATAELPQVDSVGFDPNNNTIHLYRNGEKVEPDQPLVPLNQLAPPKGDIHENIRRGVRDSSITVSIPDRKGGEAIRAELMFLQKEQKTDRGFNSVSLDVLGIPPRCDDQLLEEARADARRRFVRTGIELSARSSEQSGGDEEQPPLAPSYSTKEEWGAEVRLDLAELVTPVKLADFLP